MQSIQMQLSNKKIFFLKFFHHFLNLDKFLNILKKKYDAYSLCISEITDCEKRG